MALPGGAGAHVEMQFQTLPAGPADLMANALRLGIVHLKLRTSSPRNWLS